MEAGLTQNAAYNRLATAMSGGINSSGYFVNFLSLLPITTYTLSGALTVSSGIHLITVAGVGSMTLVPPTAAQAGTTMLICSSTANAHTVTVTEGFGGGGGSYDIATFANTPVAGFLIVAVALHWQPVGVSSVTFS